MVYVLVVSSNRGTPSHHPFECLNGIFHYNQSIQLLWKAPMSLKQMKRDKSMGTVILQPTDPKNHLTFQVHPTKGLR